MLRTVWILVGLSLALLATACLPGEFSMIQPHTPTFPMREVNLGEPAICNDIPTQRITVGQRRSICQFLGVEDESCDLENAFQATQQRIALRASYPTTIPVIDGAEPSEADPIYVLLVEGEDVGVLDQWVEEKEEIQGQVLINRNYTFHLVESLGYSPGHSPFGLTPAMAYGADITHFREQWGLDRVRKTAYYRDFGKDQGNDEVIVGVFDTSPFAPPELMVEYVARPITVALTLPNMHTPVFTMTTHFTATPGLARDHGVFVSSLISEVTPYAQIQLYRALDDYGNGTTFAISDQFNRFDRYMKAHGKTRYLVNMSFGASCREDVPPEEQAMFEKNVEFLSNLLSAWHDRGVVLVAAAGNTERADSRPESLFPASHAKVISVGALNNDGEIACFSHRAEIFLPGGDGKISKDDPDLCIPKHGTCAENPKCTDAIMGVAPGSVTGLAYWSGTSFAAPLLTGLLAHRVANPTPDILNRDRINVTQVVAELRSQTYFLSVDKVLRPAGAPAP